MSESVDVSIFKLLNVKKIDKSAKEKNVSTTNFG